MYEDLTAYLEKKKIELKNETKLALKEKNKGKTMTVTARNELVDQLLKDQGYYE